jgi:hypothetical protein
VPWLSFGNTNLVTLHPWLQAPDPPGDYMAPETPGVGWLAAHLTLVPWLFLLCADIASLSSSSHVLRLLALFFLHQRFPTKDFYCFAIHRHCWLMYAPIFSAAFETFIYSELSASVSLECNFKTPNKVISQFLSLN